MRKPRKIPSRHRREFIFPVGCVVSEVMTIFFAAFLEVCDRSRLSDHMEDAMSSVRWGIGRIVVSSLWKAVLFIYRTFAGITENWGNSLITFAAITAGVVVMFYSLIDTKSFGIPHRTIMCYFVGSFTIPVLFGLLMLNLPIVYFFDCGKYPAFVCVMTIYSMIQQYLILFLVILSTSCSFNIVMITSEEKWQYRYKKNLEGSDKRYYSAWENTHAMYAMDSDDLFADRIRLVRKLLNVPLWHIKKYHRKVYAENRWSWECENIFEYYYEQASGVFAKLDQEAKEREKFYQILYVFLEDVQRDRKLKNIVENPNYEPQYMDLMHVICGALMYAAFVNDTREIRGFISYIVHENFAEGEARRKQLIFYFLMIVFQKWTNEKKLTTDDLKLLVESGDWKIEKEDAVYCRRCWNLLVKTTSLRQDEAEKYYSRVINTYMGAGDNLPIVKLLEIMQH